MATHEHPPIAKPTRAASSQPKSSGVVRNLDAATICFAGDAGDAIQLMGTLFTNSSAQHGNYLGTEPDPPAEIRAPTGTLAGVTAYQIQFAKHVVHDAGDLLDVLIALNPSALKHYLGRLKPGGILVADSDAFSPFECQKAGYAEDPLEDGSLAAYGLLAPPITQLNRDAVSRVKHSARETERCKCFLALGLAFWLCDRSMEPALRWIRDTYDKNPVMIEAATRSMKAGYHHGETCGAPVTRLHVDKAAIPAGRYRQIDGNDALALGILAAAEATKLPAVFASFPVTPAGQLLHRLCEWKQPAVTVIQAEDDLAALNLALGAAFGGALGFTATSGPGLSLQAEALGLAVMSELPCVVIDVQRAGPSVGMPSKSEQSDLLHALYGRHGDCPLIVLAQSSPSDGFAVVLEAVRLAMRYMTPVIVLSDGHLAKTAETWQVPELHSLPSIERAKSTQNSRDANLAPPWLVPGTSGMERRLGGQEHDDATGEIDFDPANHEHMVRTRALKIAQAVDAIAPLEVVGPASGELLVLGWGSTLGAIRDAVENCRRRGTVAARAHLRHLSPMPRNTEEVLKRYRRVLVPELNAGQLASVLRSRLGVEVISLAKTQGRPFLASEIEAKIESLMQDKTS